MTAPVWSSALPADAASVFAWLAAPGALDRLLPPWMDVRVVARSGPAFGDGARVTLRLGCGPLHVDWLAEHRDHVADGSFTDVQVSGPFRRFEHVHRVIPIGSGCEIEDEVHYELRGGTLGRVVAAPLVRRTLDRTFAFRHERIRRDLLRHGALTGRPRWRIAIAGAGGLLGAGLAAFLAAGGHRVLRLVRRPPRGPDEIAWRPEDGAIDAAALEGLDAVVHLGGENLAGGRWTAARRRAIAASRAGSTALLARTLAGLASPPRVLVVASAVGFYGDRGEDEVDEGAAPGAGFLAEVVHGWESACAPATRAGVRVVNARFGVVLAARGGALARLLPAFRAGIGGRLGGGRQWVSWVSLDDAIAAIHHALRCGGLAGPVNVVAPAPVRNAELARALGGVLRRPARIAVPAWLLRAAFGAMAEETVLASTRVAPRALLASGFRFADSGLEGALRFELGR